MISDEQKKSWTPGATSERNVSLDVLGYFLNVSLMRVGMNWSEIRIL